MKYNVNFEQTKNGNSIKENSIMKIKIDGAHFISGGIYQNNFPVVMFQTQAGDNDAELLVRRKDKSLKGKAVLKIKAFDSEWREFGWTDEFLII